MGALQKSRWKLLVVPLCPLHLVPRPCRTFLRATRSGLELWFMTRTARSSLPLSMWTLMTSKICSHFSTMKTMPSDLALIWAVSTTTCTDSTTRWSTAGRWTRRRATESVSAEPRVGQGHFCAHHLRLPHTLGQGRPRSPAVLQGPRGAPALSADTLGLPTHPRPCLTPLSRAPPPSLFL